MYTLRQISKELDLGNLAFVEALDKDGNETDWTRHWDNEKRIDLSLSKKNLKEYEKDPNILFGLQKEMAVGPKGDYTRYRAVLYKQRPLLVVEV